MDKMPPEVLRLRGTRLLIEFRNTAKHRRMLYCPLGLQ
jgi:hypothetical protein